MTSTTVILLLISLFFDAVLAATKTTKRTSTPTGVSRTTVTKYKKKKGKVVPWSQLSKGAKIAVYVVCGLVGLALIGFLLLFLLRKRTNRSFIGKRNKEDAPSEVTSPSEKPFNNNDGGETWAIPPPPPSQGDNTTYFVPTQPTSHAAPQAPVGASVPHGWAN